MGDKTPQPTGSPRNLLRSTIAVLVGIVLIIVLSLAVDVVFHALKVYPPWGEPMRGTGQNLLALAYRCVIAVGGSYVTARLAPRNPMRHALILGAIGFVLSLGGAIATIPMDLGPAWYPIGLAVTALPCAWIGGLLYRPASTAQ